MLRDIDFEGVGQAVVSLRDVDFEEVGPAALLGKGDFEDVRREVARLFELVLCVLF